MLALIKKLAQNFNTQFQKNYPSSLDLEEALSYDKSIIGLPSLIT